MRELACFDGQTTKGSITIESVQPTTLKYCFDQEYLGSLFVLGFIPVVIKYNELMDLDLCAFL